MGSQTKIQPKVVPKIALALPNRQMTSRFVKCCFCSRCSGNPLRRKQEEARRRPHRVKITCLAGTTIPRSPAKFRHVASFVALWLLVLAIPARADVRILASPGGEVGSYTIYQAVLSVAAVRSTGDRRRTLLLSLHAGAEQYPP